MSQTPTPTAVAGKFQSKDGSDLIQFLDGQGRVVVWIDANGVMYINSSAVVNGVTSGPTGLSVGPGQTQ